MAAVITKELRVRLPLEAAVGSGTLLAGACLALGDIGFNQHGSEILSPNFWVRLNFTSLLVLVAIGSIVLLARSSWARVILSIAVCFQTVLLLSSVSTDMTAVFDSFSAKMAFFQLMGLSALWLPQSNDWLRR